MKTISLAVSIFLLLLTALMTALAQPQILSFDRAPSQGADARFRMQFGTNSGVVHSWTDVGTNDTVQLTNGPWGRIFVTAVQVVTNPPPYEPITIGPPSNEILITNRPFAPMRLRMLPVTNAAIRIEGTTDGNNWIHLATGFKDAATFTIPSASKTMMIRTVQLPPPP